MAYRTLDLRIRPVLRKALGRLDSSESEPLRYMTQRVDETDGPGEIRSTPSRHVISSMSVSMLTPEFSISIICSTLKPACSPATASFSMAFANDGFATDPSRKDNSVRESHASLSL